MDTKAGRRVTFLWGLKRSGIHHILNWLYANLGATAKTALTTAGLHEQLSEGYCDPRADVAFFNNCGRMHSRRFELGEIASRDFEQEAELHRSTIFGIEDCRLELASRTAEVRDARHLLVLRDPLNNIASRLAAHANRPDVFRVDEEYLDLLESYCAEFLGRSAALPRKTVVTYDRFIGDRAYRDSVAHAFGLENLDVVSEVSDYGGGSSFAGDATSPESLRTRFRQHPIPRPIIDSLVGRETVREACSKVFGYDIAAVGAES
jgi:hypothetical protein